MFNGIFHIRKPENEPVLSYTPGSKERAELKATLQEMIDNPVEVPCIIGGREVTTGKLVEIPALGPEVNGQSAWEDAAMGLRAFRRKNGEYLIFTENSGWGGKNNFFRWQP